MSKLKDVVAKAENSLSSVEKTAMSEFERQAMTNETAALIASSKGKGATEMKKAQQLQPEVPMQQPMVPPAQVQQDSMPMPSAGPAVPPVVPGAMPVDPNAIPPVDPEQQFDPNATLPMAPAAASPVMPNVNDPAASMGSPVQAQPGDISQFIDEQEQQNPNLSSDEMGIQSDMKYIGAYGDLKIRNTAQNNLEVYNPRNNQGIILIPLNAKTKASKSAMRAAAIQILKSIGSSGLSRTASAWKGRLRTADGVVDYGTTNMQPVPNTSQMGKDQSTNARGDDNFADGPDFDDMDIETATGDGSTTNMQPDQLTRNGPGLSGKGVKANRQADVIKAPGLDTNSNSLDGRETNMADENNDRPGGNALSVVDDADTTMRDKRKPFSLSKDTALEDAVSNFDEKMITGSKKSQMAPQSIPGTAPEMAGIPTSAASPVAPQAIAPNPSMPATAEADPDMDAKYAKLYRARADKEVKDRVRTFVARFTRCVRVAATRQALNLEPNRLKIAMADSLLAERSLSRHEEYMGIEPRVATILVEAGLSPETINGFVDDLIKRSASFMKMSDESLDQIEADLTNLNPAPVTADADGPEADDMEMSAQMDGDEDHVMEGQSLERSDDEGPSMDTTAARRRQAALRGNPLLNSASAPTIMEGENKRSNVRAALSSTKGLALHSFYGSR